MHFRRFQYIPIACILWNIFSLPAVSPIHTDLPLKVLCSGSGKLVKWGLVSTHPGSGSHSEEKTHKQPAGPSGLGLVQAQFLGSRARLVGVVPAFRSLRAEALGVRVSEGRAAAVGTPRTQRREGT